MAKEKAVAAADAAATEETKIERGPLTRGEYRVSVSFNPSGDEQVTKIKAMAAALLDEIDAIPTDLPITEENPHVNEERARLKAIAITTVENAAMWAVNAATKA